MPTDTERREVARRLRENAEAHPDMSLILNLAFADDSLKPDGAMEWKVTSYDAAMLLADLIDPTCLARADVEDTPDGGQFECWSCSVCGNIVSVDPDYDTETDGPAYCEMCGHRIIGKGEPTWL